jgi:nitroreductase
MDTLEAIRTRRSIRRYTDEPVSDEAVRALLEAAMRAPSAGDERPWHFVVIRDRATLAAVAKVHPYGHMAAHAAVAVLVCGDLAEESHRGMWVQDCSAATENLLLAAAALGLGAVWCGVHPRPDREDGLRKVLGIPAGVVPFALVPIGHPAETLPPEDRYDPTRIHADRW